MLAISMVFMVLAVCSAAAAADMSGNSTAVHAQNQTAGHLAGYNSTNTSSVYVGNVNFNSSQLNTVKTDFVQTNTVESHQMNYNSTNFSLVNTNAADQPSKVVISGKVTKCSTGEPFPGATVTAEKNGAVLASTTTKEDGTYNLEFMGDGSVFNVTASYPEHKSSTKEVTVIPDFNGILQGSADFQLGLDDVYVSPAGNDSTGDGTQANPYQTIGKGVSEVNAGGRVHLADGTYTGPGNRGLTIDKNVSIIGESQNGNVIDAQNADRIFNIASNANVTLQNLTLKNGTANGNSFPDNAGGAIYNSGNLTVEKCTFSGNHAHDSEPEETGGDGGAIYNTGTLQINDSIFMGNRAGDGGSSSFYPPGGNGGAIYNAGNSTVANCTFSDNRAGNGVNSRYNVDGGYSGAIHNTGNLNVVNSIFSDNHAGDCVAGGVGGPGGAISNYGTLNITNCAFSDNRAGFGGLGGAIYNTGDLTAENCNFNDDSAGDGDLEEYGGYAGNGGAIYNSGDLTVNNCNFSDNRAGSGGSFWISHILGGFGGAIYNSGDLTVNNCTFSDNHAGTGGSGGAIANGNYPAGTLTVTNSTFIDNLAGNGGSGFNEGPGGDGGAIYNGGTSNIENSFFTGNRAGNGGPGYFAGPGGSGGAVGNYGYLSVERCTFYGNHAGIGVSEEVNGSGGAIYNYNSALNVTCSNFENNTAQDNGGAIWNHGGDATNRRVNFNRIVGNSPSNGEVYSENGALDARLNWWDSKNSPAGNISTGAGGVVLFDPWLVLTVAADPTTISNGNNSIVAADLLHDSNGVYHDPALGHVPDGIPITLTTNWGSFNSPSITLGTVNGSVTAVFHADGGTTPLNPVQITASADNAAVSVFISIIGAVNPGSVINITLGGNSSILDPNQTQTQNQTQNQTQTSIIKNTNNLMNTNINTANSTSSAVNENNVSNSNMIDPVMILG